MQNVSSKYHTHTRAKCERAICALCRVVILELLSCNMTTQIFMYSTFAPVWVCILLLMSLVRSLDMAHSVRDASHLVWFIMEIYCTPYVLGLAVTVVLCIILSMPCTYN